MVLRRYDFEADPEYRLKIVESLTLKPSGFTVRPTLRKRAAVSAG
jgi:unspecific monooxygenase